MLRSGLAIALGCLALPAAAQDTLVSTARDTRGLSLTVYNQGFAAVRERREILMRAGVMPLRYEDVAQTIEAPTVSFKSITAPDQVSVREQNYQYDLVSPGAILQRSIGGLLRFRRVSPTGAVEYLEGTLVSAPGQGGMVLRLADGRMVLNPGGEVEVAQLPGGLISRPSLLWQLDARRGGRHTTEVSYLAGGLSWTADYVAIANAREDAVDFSGWVTLNNQSGTTFGDAQLQLLAGDVRVVTPRGVRRQSGVEIEGLVVTALGTQRFAEEGFFEYHLYTLDGRTTLANNETKQIALLSAPEVGVTRRLVFDSRRAWGWSDWREGQPSRTEGVRAAIVLELPNTARNGMGLPLPAGVIRLYKSDARGNLQFLGEDRIEHTPRDEMVRLYVGDAFDVVGTRRVVEDRRVNGNTREMVNEISIRNHKDTPADVRLMEHFGSEWRILESTHPHRREDAGTASFDLRVPPNGEVRVTYKLRVWW